MSASMIRFVRLAILVALALGVARAAHAQTWFQVAQESASSTLTIPAGVTYQLGTTSCAATGAAAWSAPITVTAATTFSPLSMSVAGVFPFADPCAGYVKTLDVQETSAAQTLTLNGAPFQVPALASSAPVNCPAPATFSANPEMPAAPPNCAPLANEIPVASDGSTITEMLVAAPVIFQYCQGSGAGQICDAPFMFIGLPITVGPNAQCGGPTGFQAAAGNAPPGTLYAVESDRQTTVTFSAPDGTPQPPLSVPAAAPI
jgi:hypothetical protein